MTNSSPSFSPTWRELGLVLNQFMRENSDQPPKVIRFNGDTGDDLIGEPRFKEFVNRGLVFNKREFLKQILEGFNLELFIDSRLPRGKIVVE